MKINKTQRVPEQSGAELGVRERRLNAEVQCGQEALGFHGLTAFSHWGLGTKLLINPRKSAAPTHGMIKCFQATSTNSGSQGNGDGNMDRRTGPKLHEVSRNS